MTPYEELLNGKIIEAVILLFDNVLLDFWKIMLYIFTMLLLYRTTKQPIMAAIVSFIGAAILVNRELIGVESHGTIFIIIILSLGLTIYGVFGKGD